MRSIVNAIFLADPAVLQPRGCRLARVRTRAVDRNTQPDSSGCGPDSAGFAVVFVVFFLGARPLHRSRLIDVRVDAVTTGVRPPACLTFMVTLMRDIRLTCPRSQETAMKDFNRLFKANQTQIHHACLIVSRIYIPRPVKL